MVVTTPSPVAKPKKAKSSTPPASAPSSGEAAAAPPAPVPELQPLPGAIVDDQAFVAVTVATQRELEANGGATITDTLQLKPGISGTTFAPGADRPIIRGLDSYRVRTQENGIGTHDVAAISEDHAIPIDPLAADRVEVVRGPATLRYGSQAIGGVVSVENERIPTFIPRGGFTGRILGGYSSVDDGADGAISATAGSGGFAIHADAFKREADDYASPRGTVLNSFVESDGASLGASLIGTDGFLGVSYTRFASLYGIPGEEAEEGVNPRIDMVQDKVQAKGEWRVRGSGIDTIRFWFGASDYEHGEFAIHDPATETEFELGSRFTNKEQEARVEIQHLPVATSMGELTRCRRHSRRQPQDARRELRGRFPAGAGAYAKRRAVLVRGAGADAGAARASGNTRRADDGRWPRLVRRHRSCGARGICRRARIRSGQRWPRPSVRVALRRRGAPQRAIRRARPGRCRTVLKGHARGDRHVRDRQSVPHRGKGVDRRDRLEESHRRLPLRRLDLLHAVSAASSIDSSLASNCGTVPRSSAAAGSAETKRSRRSFFQQRNAKFYGAELAAQYDVAPIWNGVWGLDAQYDFVRAQFEDGENVPRIPPHRLGGGVYYHDANWLARVGALHAFEQDEFGLNEIATPGYTLISAELSYTTLVKAPDGTASQVTVGIKGENLADDEVLNHTSFKRREEVLQPGASVRAFGIVKLN